MAPEQITDFAAVTTAADLYSLGAMAYELTCGTRPFTHADPSQVVRLQFTTDPEPLAVRVAGVPPAFDALVLRLLAREADRRPTLDESAAIVASL